MVPLRVAVVGGGIAGLAAAWQLRQRAAAGGRPVAVRLVEAAPRLGGLVRSERRDGFLVEAGPDSFVVRKPAAVELAREAGIGDRLVGTVPERQRVWLLRRGRMVELPPGMGVVPCRLAPVFASEVLSWRGKLRLALDLVLPRRRGRGDESLAAFLRRRFGREALEAFAGPLLAGIYAADPETLSLQATFPHFAAIERHRGSLIRGLAEAGGAGSPASPRVAPAGGMGELVDAVVAALGREAGEGEAGPFRWEVSTGRRVVRLEAEPLEERGEAAPRAPRAEVAEAEACAGSSRPERRTAWRLTLDDGTSFLADAAVLALPAFAAAPLLAGPAPAAASALGAIGDVSTATVTLAFDETGLARPLDGYGFVVPAAEGRRITAATFSSAKLPHRAPPGGALVRVFLGGPAGGALLDGEDGELAATAREELAALWGLAAAPRWAVVHRQLRATPRYEVGHRERIAALRAALPPGLHLAGAAYDGIGVPDCVASGRRAADAAWAATA